jgi:5S rRNA maturation endonuclease (ribonuclease M5)
MLAETLIDADVPTMPLAHGMLDFNDAEDAAPAGHDKGEVRRHLISQFDAALAYLFPAGKRQGSRFVVGNVRGDAGDSLVIELEGEKCGVWCDFATSESGDALALWAAARGHRLPQDFGGLLDDIGQWLALPKSAPSKKTKPAVAVDELGPATGKWNYFSAEGELLACVYRYDTPKGKQYRPWDVRSRSMRMPEPRPLYRLPEVVAADTVVLVEGEKCADALASIGIVATSAMGGAATAIDKTDWTPLHGKAVAVWPDHDDAGAKYADAVTAKLAGLGVRVGRIVVPTDKSKKWDAADAVAEGLDVHALIADAQPVASSAVQRGSWQIADWRAVERFVGEPKPRRWLIEGVFPQAQVALVAASGGVGKSFLLLALAREVAAHDGVWANAPSLFGGGLSGQGVAVYVTAEDDAIEVHNRLNSLGPIPDRLYVVPLPDAGGSVPLFAPDGSSRGPGITAAWQDLERQLHAIPSLTVIVLDPLQPLCALDLNVPENAQFVCSRLAALAASTGASVIIAHHFAKREAYSPEQAREAIRGTGGLVDGVRSVYALWAPRDDHAKHICEQLGEDHRRGTVVLGAVVKANGRANMKVAAFLRSSSGLLVDRSQDLACAKQPLEESLLPLLRDAIGHAAERGKPYTKTGGNGVYDRRHELPDEFHCIGKHRLTAWVATLLQKGELVLAMAGSKVVKWLDVPGGPMATGNAVFTVGHLSQYDPETPGVI